MKYLIKTFGCQMNVHESEKLSGMLEELNYTKTDDIKSADLVIFNTCCIRDGVEQKIMGNIGALKPLKKKNPNLIIGVCGCMSQAEGRDKIIANKFPFVDIIFGTHNIHTLKELIEFVTYGKKKKAYSKISLCLETIFILMLGLILTLAATTFVLIA